LLRESQLLGVERDQLGPPKRSRVPEEEQRASRVTSWSSGIAIRIAGRCSMSSGSFFRTATPRLRL